MTDTQGPLYGKYLYKKNQDNHLYTAAICTHLIKRWSLQNARDLYTRRNEGVAIWVVPSSAIVASSPEDQGSFFEPANDKIFRHPTFYQIPDGVGAHVILSYLS